MSDERTEYLDALLGYEILAQKRYGGSPDDLVEGELAWDSSLGEYETTHWRIDPGTVQPNPEHSISRHRGIFAKAIGKQVKAESAYSTVEWIGELHYDRFKDEFYLVDAHPADGSHDVGRNPHQVIDSHIPPEVLDRNEEEIDMTDADALRAVIEGVIKSQGKTPEQVNQDKIMATLDELGKLTTGDDSLIFEGTKFVLPESMQGNIPVAIKYLQDWDKSMNQTFEFDRRFNYRPWDGAYAFNNAMLKMFGTAGIGQSIETMFGEIKPSYVSINVSPTEQVQVPWGHIRFSPLDATFMLQASSHEEYGLIFSISVEAPKKHRARIEAFFQLVERELKQNSIYRGKAFTGGTEPQFIDTSRVDPSKVIYSEDVMVQLDTNMWSLIRYTDRMRENNIPLKRAVLVHGPYGTGKTLAGMLTAREAVANGWTFILARPGKDDLNTVLQTAQLYSPAVVWYEDIDVLAQGHSDTQISKLLDSLDGITNKGTEVLAGFTTNHVDKIQKGVLRPGRLDAVIEVGGLDREGYEKLVKVTVEPSLLGEIDYDKVAVAFEDFLPAFAKEAIDRAVRYSIARNQGETSVITTEDLCHAADGLRPQLQLMQQAEEGVHKDSLTEALTGVMRSALDGTPVFDNYDDEVYKLRRPDREDVVSPEYSD